MPAISAIVRTFNSEATLAQCLRSLQMQSLPPRELIIVDSGSTDQTLSIAAQFGARIVPYPRDESFNYSRSLNLGIAASHGDWLLLFSSHNVMLLDTCLAMLHRAADQTSVIAAYAVTSQVADTCRDELKPTEINAANFDGSNGLWNTCALVRRTAWDAMPFDETIHAAEDQAWANAHFSKGARTMRIEPGNVLCLNPHPLFWKHLRDQIVIATQVIGPERSPSFSTRMVNGARELKQGNARQAMLTWCTAIGIIAHRLGLLRLQSRYV